MLNDSYYIEISSVARFKHKNNYKIILNGCCITETKIPSFLSYTHNDFLVNIFININNRNR